MGLGSSPECFPGSDDTLSICPFPTVPMVGRHFVHTVMANHRDVRFLFGGIVVFQMVNFVILKFKMYNFDFFSDKSHPLISQTAMYLASLESLLKM